MTWRLVTVNIKLCCARYVQLIFIRYVIEYNAAETVNINFATRISNNSDLFQLLNAILFVT